MSSIINESVLTPENFDKRLRAANVFIVDLWVRPNSQLFGMATESSSTSHHKWRTVGFILAKHCKRLRDGALGLKPSKDFPITYFDAVAESVKTAILNKDNGILITHLQNVQLKNIKAVVGACKLQTGGNDDDDDDNNDARWCDSLYRTAGVMLRTSRPHVRNIAQLQLPAGITHDQYIFAFKRMFELQLHKRHIQTRQQLFHAWHHFNDSTLIGLSFLSIEQLNALAGEEINKYGKTRTYTLKPEMVDILDQHGYDNVDPHATPYEQLLQSDFVDTCANLLVEAATDVSAAGVSGSNGIFSTTFMKYLTFSKNHCAPLTVRNQKVVPARTTTVTDDNNKAQKRLARTNILLPDNDQQLLHHNARHRRRRTTSAERKCLDDDLVWLNKKKSKADRKAAEAGRTYGRGGAARKAPITYTTLDFVDTDVDTSSDDELAFVIL